ncbi:hypothetical protein D9M69_659330 [compost metagenome]
MRAQHVVAGLEQAHAHHEDGRHARGGGDAGLGAFERGQPLLEAGHRGVAVASVGEAFLVAREAARGRFGAGLHVAAGEVQGFGVFAVLASFDSFAHGQRVAMQFGFLLGHRQ